MPAFRGWHLYYDSSIEKSSSTEISKYRESLRASSVSDSKQGVWHSSVYSVKLRPKETEGGVSWRKKKP